MSTLNLENKNISSMLNEMSISKGFNIRLFQEEDFKEIQKLYENEGWMTVVKRPEDGLKAWKNSNLALVALQDNKITGVVRAFTDTEITTYIIELLVGQDFRGKGIGKALIDVCHLLYPKARIEVLASETSIEFYKAHGFRDFLGLRKSYI